MILLFFEFEGNPECNLSRIIKRQHGGGFDHTMHLIKWRNHLMLISPGKTDAVLKQYACSKCSYVTNQSCNLTTHEKTCFKKEPNYQTGVYTPTQPLYLRAQEHGIEFPEGCKVYPFKFIWDIESAIMKTDYVPQSKRRRVEGEERSTHFTAEHSLLSIAAVTNIPHPELPSTACFVREGDEIKDIEKVIDDWMKWNKEFANAAQSEMMRKFQSTLEEIEKKIEEQRESENDFMECEPIIFSDEEETVQDAIEGVRHNEGQQQHDVRDVRGFFDDAAEDAGDIFENDEEDEEVIEKKRVSIDKTPLEVLRDDLIFWLSQVPVIAFNGSKYDLNVVREYLYPKLISEYGAK